jgi:hypothetical protein
MFRSGRGGSIDVFFTSPLVGVVKGSCSAETEAANNIDASAIRGAFIFIERLMCAHRRD